MPANKKNQQAILISIGCLLFFSFPLLSIANKKISIGPIPLLYCYLFAGWLFFILLIWKNNTHSNNNSGET